MLTYSFLNIENSKEPLVYVDQDVKFEADFFDRAKDFILDIKNVHIKGQFFYQDPFVTGNFEVEYDVIVPSTRSLKPVSIKNSFTFTENYAEVLPSEDEDAGTVILIENDIIDLQKAVEDNLLLNLPNINLTDAEKENGEFPEGEGWTVISEENYKNRPRNTINPQFDKLKNLFNK